MKAYCFSRNIRFDYDNTENECKESRCKLKHKREFDGQHIPLGALIELKPFLIGGAIEKAHGKMKHGPCGKYGVSMGYNQRSGGQYKKEYIVVALRDFSTQDFAVDNKHNSDDQHYHIVRDVQVCNFDSETTTFPLRPAYLDANAPLYGIKRGIKVKYDQAAVLSEPREEFHLKCDKEGPAITVDPMTGKAL